MKDIIVTLFLLIGCQNLMAHGGHSAIFKYQINPNFIELEFQIESIVLDHFDLEKNCESYDIATAWCIGQYINSKNKIIFNNSKIDFELVSSKRGENYFSVKMIAKGDFSNFQNLTLRNKCFFEFDKKFENRVIIQNSEGVKSYLLNRKNTDIEISKFQL